MAMSFTLPSTKDLFLSHHHQILPLKHSNSTYNKNILNNTCRQFLNGFPVTQTLHPQLPMT